MYIEREKFYEKAGNWVKAHFTAKRLTDIIFVILVCGAYRLFE